MQKVGALTNKGYVRYYQLMIFWMIIKKWNISFLKCNLIWFLLSSEAYYLNSRMLKLNKFHWNVLMEKHIF